ncbi:MAG: hypothetical protein RLZZ587_917 [Actinomycetota bacterium]
MRRLPSISFASIAVASAIALCGSPALATNGKISLSPDPASISRGESTTFTIDLAEPAICVEEDPCLVVLDLSSDLPEGLTLEPGVVTIAASNWWQTVTVTASLDADAPAISGDEFTVTAIADSGSEYYDGYETSITFAVTEDQVPVLDELAETGISDRLLQFGAFAVVAIGAASAVRLRSRQTR